MEPAWCDRSLILLELEPMISFHTMLNQSRAGLEPSCRVDINITPTKGKIPSIISIILYFPVRCINQLYTGGEGEGTKSKKG